MKTVSFWIENYCVPCSAHCRHCLLSSCGKATGVDYETGERFADRVMTELAQKRPELPTGYFIGYCMDTPKLRQYLKFRREHHLPGAGFLQMNGFAFRSAEELDVLMTELAEEQVELLDLTFYGTEAYHDRFAGRPGDQAFLLRMLDAANRAGISVSVSIPIIRENMGQLSELRSLLDAHGAERCIYFLPNSKGRGKMMQDQRITLQEFEALPDFVRTNFIKTPNRTEAEWIRSGELSESGKRTLTLVLTPENLVRYGKMPAEEIVRELEDADDRFAEKLPSVQTLAEHYGRPDNEQLYRLRDLLLEWRQKYLEDLRKNGEDLYDMQDESHSFSIYL